ncbi:hemerythrin domain-containing protein [Actinacidiphila paucisporea]|uniref:Hemerythrin HHE cation binding domain-containing protein n=1 Tax=Actinacidiphila paucisporea TaxID=310782 RepID=A0A1M7LPN5_9ACTN|nr:hemerythrin domain-containing protein [Actinacidiphila paucisporea]SHM80060.1 Hemerythrin HHE cation binding domain-containing protein [Actinacidiphila paucisporea]
MGTAQDERMAAAQLPQGDIVALLLEQHARIRDLFTQVKNSQGEARQQAFDGLRALLAVHEAAEELVVRPVAKKTAGEGEAEARNHEEAEATKVLKQLEGMDLSSPDFERLIAEFEQAVSDHADHEEAEEFPALVAQCSQEQRRTMGERLSKVEHLAPTHPHPTAAGKPAALALTGPFAAMMDKARDAMRS